MATSSISTLSSPAGQKRKATLAASLLSGLGKKRGRGTGICGECSEQYTNRSKPKFCKCGAHLGGTFVKKIEDKPEPEPELVEMAND